jgi:hypothetical protein
MAETSLQEMIRALPPELRNEVRDFVAFLLSRQSQKRRIMHDPIKNTKMSFAWQGVLKDMSIRYTSVELQHKIADMRTGQDETAS